MITISYYELISIITIILLIIVSADLLRFRRKYLRLEKEHEASLREGTRLTSECAELRERITQNEGFKSDLAQASVTTKLQFSRLDSSQQSSSGQAPERYLYVKRLLESGMDSEKIGSLLGISSREADQLVSLAKIAADR